MTESMAATDKRDVTWGWWLLVLVGILSGIAGVILLFQPASSLATLAVIAGIFLLMDGILELTSSVMRATPNRGLVAILGVLTVIAGVLLIRHPIGGITAVALLIGIWLIAAGIIRFVTAFEEYEHRVWYAFLGLIELLAGIVIVANPDIGYTTLAIFVGIAFILNGIGMTALGFGMHGLAREAEKQSSSASSSESPAWSS